MLLVPDSFGWAIYRNETLQAAAWIGRHPPFPKSLDLEDGL
jgi:hypothetical protein